MRVSRDLSPLGPNAPEMTCPTPSVYRARESSGPPRHTASQQQLLEVPAAIPVAVLDIALKPEGPIASGRGVPKIHVPGAGVGLVHLRGRR